jgi:dipeptidyl aminopeptidase/acylaminoacyl peptidase
MHAVQWIKRVLLLGIAVIGTWAVPAMAEMPPIDDYTRWPAIEDVAVSPSGKRLAALVFNKNGMRQLAVMDLDPVGKGQIVGGFPDADVTRVRWLTDDRLVYEAFARGYEIREGDGGSFAVNHDGSDFRPLIAWRHSLNITKTLIAPRILPYGWEVHSTIGDGSNDIFVRRIVRDNRGEFKEIQLARLDTYTLELRKLNYELPANAVSVHLDPSREPRMATAHRGGRTKVFWRATSGGAWDEVADFDPLNEGFTPWYIGAEGLVLVRATTKGTKALYRFDPLTKKLDAEPLVQVKGFDLASDAEVDGRTHRLMGLHFVADRPMSYWFDDGMAHVQASVDAALPAGRSNRLYCGECETTTFFVVRSASDRQPGEYYLFNRKKATLERIGSSMPWIKEAEQGRRSFHRYEARDGLKVPVVVTHPAGAASDKPLPTVVIAHGGPFLRGADLSWNAEAQFLASRGYRVLEPQFRGSTGFGHQHFKAGWKQWGNGMLDDLADAVQWAAKQGLTDPARVCIAGGGYGGYAALMSPIAHPGVYRCAAAVGAFTDPLLMYSVSWSDLTDEALKYGFPVLMGDPESDSGLLSAISPLKRAAEIKVPVLLAYGGLSRRVPSIHADKFSDAAKKAGVALEKAFYAEEGQGFHDPANATNYYERMERLLKASLQSPD